MDGLIIIVLVKELWERVNLAVVVSLFALISGAAGGILAMYVRYRVDRERLKISESERQEIRDDIIEIKREMKDHEVDNTESYKEIVNMIISNNEKFYEKIDNKNKEVKDDLGIATQRLYAHIDKRNDEVNSLLKEIRFSLMRKNNENGSK